MKSDLLGFWMPFLMVILITYFLMRKRIKILNIRGKDGNGSFFYQLFIGGTILAPLLISQHYLEKISYELIHVNDISEVRKYPAEKYFSVQQYEVKPDKAAYYSTARSSGRNNQYLNYSLFVSIPFENTNSCWYGVNYDTQVSNYSSDESKKVEYHSFISLSEFKLKHYKFNDVDYFEKVVYSDEYDGYVRAIRSNYFYRQKITSSEVILIPQKGEFNMRAGDSRNWIFYSFGIGNLIILIMITIPKIHKPRFKTFVENVPSKKEGFSDVSQFLNLVGKCRVTALLILINSVVFCVMVISGVNVISPTSVELMEFGANRRYEVLSGEYWRLMTSVFVHMGLTHIVWNMISLAIVSSLLEIILNRYLLLVCYLFCGLMASLSSIFWYSNITSVGASGAIFGLFGIIFSFNILKMFEVESRSFMWWLLFIFPFMTMVFGIFMNLDNAAHLGGFVSGTILGIVIVISNKKQLKNRINSQKANLL